MSSGPERTGMTILPLTSLSGAGGALKVNRFWKIVFAPVLLATAEKTNREIKFRPAMIAQRADLDGGSAFSDRSPNQNNK